MMALVKCKPLVLPSFRGAANRLRSTRFVLTTTEEVKDRQTKDSGNVDKELENLNKKLHYLETTYKNANEHIERIFKGTGG